ncbi:MAG TPA: heavy metal-associated domain-containing protein [Fimbriimonas sp.]
MTTFEYTFTCPDIRNQIDAQQIREYLSLSPGIDLVEVDLQQKKVTVTTASQDGGKDVVHRLSQAGYPPED